MFTSYPQALFALALLCLAFSVVSCALCLQKQDTGPLKRSQADLKLRLDMLEAEQSQLTAAWKRTNARIAMAQARDKARNGGSDDELPDPKDDPEGWRAAVRQKFLIKR